ncbi:hypothetical protein [Streptomyces paromomycinus]|uniref:Uncharacterized protein n=1 Tax=Streptomyces paromomycinus TaxID=92743 RepID=A0A401W5L6_STREY|nr:hypothetical protein [Streptomyces paromomycinus]GCD44592.1 hypothetical protein GKJPGBOP_04292 [Streptomyces paromomycinus]
MEWIDPRYEQVVADLRARQRAEAEEGRVPRPLRGFVVPLRESGDED